MIKDPFESASSPVPQISTRHLWGMREDTAQGREGHFRLFLSLVVQLFIKLTFLVEPRLVQLTVTDKKLMQLFIDFFRLTVFGFDRKRRRVPWRSTMVFSDKRRNGRPVITLATGKPLATSKYGLGGLW